MKLTIFGSTGSVGRHLVMQALDAGHEVVAYARAPERVPRREELIVRIGEVTNRPLIASAIRGADAVLCALGAKENRAEQVMLFGEAMTNITEAMEEQGVSRLVSISGAAVFLPEDRVTLGRRFVRSALKLAGRYVLEAKEREREIICSTALDWVLVRPPRIVIGEMTGVYKVLADRVPSSSIRQGDVAHFMLRCIKGDEWVRRGPILGY